MREGKRNQPIQKNLFYSYCYTYNFFSRAQINHYFPKFFRSDDTETPEKVLLIAQGSTPLGMKAAPKTRPHLEKHVGRQLSACEGGTGWGNSARIAGVKSGGSRLFLDGRSILQLGSMVLDEVAQVFQLDGKIDIVDRDRNLA